MFLWKTSNVAQRLIAVVCAVTLPTPSLANFAQDHPLLAQTVANYLGVMVALVVLFLLLIVVLTGVLIRNQHLLNSHSNQIKLQGTELVFHKSALDVHAIVCVTDAKGRLVQVNENFKRVTGFTDDDIQGLKTVDLWVDVPGQEKFDAIAQHVTRGEPWSGEIATRRKDGGIFWAQTSVVPFLDEAGKLINAVSIRTDITENKKAQNRKQLAASLDFLEDEICMFWPDTLKFFYMNKAARTQQGWSEAQYRQKTVFEVKENFNAQEFRAVIADLMQCETGASTHDFETSDNRAVEVTLQYVTPAGERPRMVCVVRDVTARKRAQERIVELNTALDLSVSPIYMLDQETLRYSYLNRAALRKQGWTKEEALQKTPFDSEPDFDEAAFRNRVAVLDNGSEHTITYEQRGAGQQISEISVQRLELAGGLRYFIVATDMSERQSAMAEIAKFKTALDLSPDAVHMFYPDTCKFHYGNRAALNLLGVDEAQFLQMTPMDTNPYLTEDMLRKRMAGLMRGTHRSEVYQAEHMDSQGRPIPVQVNLQYIAPKGEEGRFVALIRDLSSAQKVVDEKSQFVSAVSQQMGASLATIKGALAAFENTEALSPCVAKSLSSAHQSCNRLERVVHASAELERMRRGAKALKCQTVDFAQIVRGELEKMQPTAKDKGIDLNVSLPQDPAQVRADPARLAQAIAGLLQNAFSQTPKGSAVAVTLRPDATGFRLSVRDSGAGLPEPVHNRVFEQFFRFESSNSTQMTSPHGAAATQTGLDLCLSKAITEAHNGTIGFSSAVGMGSTFWINLPEDNGALVAQEVVQPAVTAAE